MLSCKASAQPKAASDFTPLGFSFWSQNQKHVKHCVANDRKRRTGVAGGSSSCATPFRKLDDRTKVEAVVLVWDSAEREGGGFLLPCIDGESWYTDRFGPASEDNIGWGVYATVGVAILWMDRMQVQFYLQNFVDNLPDLKSDEWFPNLKFIVGSGTCSTFCDPLGTICVSSNWINGFTQPLTSSIDTLQAATKLKFRPLRGVGEIYLAVPPRISDGICLSATDNTNPGSSCDPANCLDEDYAPVSCYTPNKPTLASNSGFTEAELDAYLNDELGLTPESNTETPRHLETDDYYLQAVVAAKMEGVQVFTSRAVTDNYCASDPCPPGQGFSSTYHKIWLTQSAILTAIQIIAGLDQHTPVIKPRYRPQGPPPFIETCYCKP